MRTTPIKISGSFASKPLIEPFRSAALVCPASETGNNTNSIERLSGAATLENRSGPRVATGWRPAGPAHGPITIILGEERPIMRQGIENLLAVEKDMVVVGQAGDLSQLVELAAELKPSVVIVAISIALELGLKDLKRVLDEKCRAAVLMLVPHDSNSLWRHISESGVGGFISEQSGPDHLAAAIRQAHNRRGANTGAGTHADRKPARITTQKGLPKRASLPLTARELQVLRYVADGNTNKLMASRLSISVKTLEKHRQNLMDKLEIHDTATLTRYAIYAGVVRVSESAA